MIVTGSCSLQQALRLPESNGRRTCETNTHFSIIIAYMRATKVELGNENKSGET